MSEERQKESWIRGLVPIKDRDGEIRTQSMRAKEERGREWKELEGNAIMSFSRSAMRTEDVGRSRAQRGEEGGRHIVGRQSIGNDHTTPRNRRKSEEGKDTAMCDVGRRRGRAGPTKRRWRRKASRAVGMVGTRKRRGGQTG